MRVFGSRNSGVRGGGGRKEETCPAPANGPHFWKEESCPPRPLGFLIEKPRVLSWFVALKCW